MDIELTCPHCGGPLVDRTADTNTESAPYICARDAKAWWGSELTSVARENYNPQTRSFKHGDILFNLQTAVKEERDRRRKPPKPPQPIPDPKPTDPAKGV